MQICCLYGKKNWSKSLCPPRRSGWSKTQNGHDSVCLPYGKRHEESLKHKRLALMPVIHPLDSFKLDALLCIKEICRVLMLLRHGCYTWFQIIQKSCIHVYPGNTLFWTVICAWFLCLIFHFARFNHFVFLNKFLTLRPKHILSLMDTRVFCERSSSDRQLLGLWNVILCFCLKMSSCFLQHFCHTYLQFAPGITKQVSPSQCK